MGKQVFQFPGYAKLALVLLSLCLIIIILYLGQDILFPLFLSLLFAILLRPLVGFFHTKCRIPHVIAVLVAVIIFVILFAALFFFISWQVSEITEDWIKIKQNLSVHYQQVQQWIKESYRVSYYKQNNYIDQVTEGTLKGGAKLGNTLSSFADVLINIILVPIYTFLILLYRNLFIEFLSKLLGRGNEQKLQDVLINVKTVVQSYLVGLLIQMGVVGVLTTAGLMILGVEYAVLLGVITAILNLIPYIGIMVAALISILALLVNSNDISVILGVIVLTAVVQFIDNNILAPKIVGDKVRINGLVSMVGIIVGGAIAGVAGMFLAIPLIAILKVIFDRVEPLASWGFLMGDNLDKTLKWHKLKLPKFNHGNASDTIHSENVNKT